ncbi:MAG TPA: hypothetical protein PLT16_02630, partial [Daejeonella sp.]|nr:hypothetical protein [Daejeonella sp.]
VNILNCIFIAKYAISTYIKEVPFKSKIQWYIVQINSSPIHSLLFRVAYSQHPYSHNNYSAYSQILNVRSVKTM